MLLSVTWNDTCTLVTTSVSKGGQVSRRENSAGRSERPEKLDLLSLGEESGVMEK